MIELSATDMYNGNIHNYPCHPLDVTKINKKFDFIFTKENKWYYNSSSNNPEDFIQEVNLVEAVESKGESWKIINAITGEIYKENVEIICK